MSVRVLQVREPSSEGSRRRERHRSMIKLVREYCYSAEGLLVSHQVDDEGCRGDKEDLHEGVVQTDVVHEEVHIPHAEDKQVELLGFTGKTYNIKN